jgi:hypothetical protein
VTESQFSSKLLRALRQRLPTAVIWKLNDHFTSGIPDAVVVYEGIATWLEFKLNDNRATKIQWETLRMLERGWIIYWYTKGIKGAVVCHVTTQPQNCFIAFSGPFDELVDYMVNVCKT